MKTLVTLSGGLDSAVVLAKMLRCGPCAAILFDYGQPHIIELNYARAIADARGVHHSTVKMWPIPLVDDVVFAGRNMVMASMAVSLAIAGAFDAVAFGCNRSDWSRFPDCRPEFWRGVSGAAEAYGVKVFTPLLHMSKADIVREAAQEDVSLAETWSCYTPAGDEPCGLCLTCMTRNEAAASVRSVTNG